MLLHKQQKDWENQTTRVLEQFVCEEEQQLQKSLFQGHHVYQIPV